MMIDKNYGKEGSEEEHSYYNWSSHLRDMISEESHNSLTELAHSLGKHMEYIQDVIKTIWSDIERIERLGEKE